MVKFLLLFLVSLFVTVGAATTPDYFKVLQTKRVSSTPFVQWTNFGPGMSGYCDEFFVHPTDPNAMYMSLDMGNSYYTHDGAQSWITMQDWDHDGEGGRPVWMDYSHQNPNFGFAIDEKGMLRKTLDKGKTWLNIRSFDKKHSVISVDPNNDNNWYVGAGQFWRVKDIHRSLKNLHGTQYRNTSYGHLLISKDKGSTWTKITDNFPATLDVAKIFVDPRDSKTVYMYSNYGFYKSVDGGYTWSLKGKGLPYNQPRDGDWYYNKKTGQYVLYLVEQTHYEADGHGSIRTTGGIYKSIDGGETWINITGNLALDMTKITLYNARDKYYRAIAYWFGIDKSVAQSTYNVLPTATYSVFNRIVVSKKDPNIIFISNNVKHDFAFGPADVMRSKDGGKTWIVVARHGQYWINKKDKAYWESRNNPQGMNMTYAHLEHEMRDFDMTPGTRMMTINNRDELFIVHEQQLLRSVDYGETWQQIDDDETEKGSHHWVGRGGSNLPGESFTLETGMSRYLFASGEHGLWISASGGDKVKKGKIAVEQLSGQSKSPYDATSICAVAVNPNDTNKIYMLMFRQSERGHVRYSADGGKTWNNIAYPCKSSTGISSEANKIMQYDLMFDKSNTNNMFFTVPKSRWVSYMPNLWERNGPSDFNGFGVYRSKDEGKTWALANNGLPQGCSVARITMDPKNSKIMYAALNRVNYSGEAVVNGGLYKTVNGADSWTKVNIPSNIESVNHVSINKTNGHIYIACGEYKGAIDNGGVWVSKDGGISWNKIFYMPHVRECYASPVNSNLLLVNVGRGQAVGSLNAGVFYSKDAGITWTKANYQLGQPGRIRKLQPDPKNENVFWLACKGSGWYKGVINTKHVRTMADNIYMEEGATKKLDASGSFGTDLKYKWIAPSGLKLSSQTSANPKITAGYVDKTTVYKVLLMAYPNGSVLGGNSTDTLEVLVTVKDTGANETPVIPSDTVYFVSCDDKIQTTNKVSAIIGYRASKELEVALILTSSTGTWLGNAKQVVSVGTDTLDMTINLANDLPIGNGYKLACTIRKVGGNFVDNLAMNDTLINVVGSTSVKIATKNSELLKIYPNPSRVIINVSSSVDGNAFLVTPLGVVIKKLAKGENSILKLKKGIYFVVIKKDGDIKTAVPFYKIK